MRIVEDRQVSDHRHRATARVGDLTRELYGAFVAWGSAYDDADEGADQEARQARVAELLGEAYVRFLPQSVWIEKAGRKKVEEFIARAEELYARFSREIAARGYTRVRSDLARRVSKELGPLKREAEASLGVEIPGRRRRGRRRGLRAPSGGR
jgi:hypothetical protein